MTAKSDAAEAKLAEADTPAEPPAPLLHVLAAAVHANVSPTFKNAIEASLKFHHGHDKESLAAPKEPKEDKHHAVSGHSSSHR